MQARSGKGSQQLLVELASAVPRQAQHLLSRPVPNTSHAVRYRRQARERASGKDRETIDRSDRILLEVVEHVDLLVFRGRGLLGLDQLLGHERLDDLGDLLLAQVAARAQVPHPDA